MHTNTSNPFQSQPTSNSPQELPCLRVSTTAAAHRTSHRLNRKERSCPPILYFHLLRVTHIISMARFQGPDGQTNNPSDQNRQTVSQEQPAPLAARHLQTLSDGLPPPHPAEDNPLITTHHRLCTFRMLLHLYHMNDRNCVLFPSKLQNILSDTVYFIFGHSEEGK